MKRRAVSLTEVLVSVVVMAFVFSGLFAAFIGFLRVQGNATNNPTVQENARQMVEILAAGFRDATLCASGDTGCTQNAGLSNANASSVTLYSRSGSSLVQTTYGINSGTFYKTVNSTTTNFFTGASLTITYYTSSSSTAYNTNSLTAYASTYPLSTTVTPTVIGAYIQATVTSKGLTGAYSTFVRMRNSP